MSAPQPYQPNPQQQPYYQPQQGHYPYPPQYYQQQPLYNPYVVPGLPFEPGNFFLRFLAWLLDDMIAGMLTGVVIGCLWGIGLLIGFLAGEAGGMIAAGFMLWFISIPVAIIVFFTYHVQFETGRMQATPAKKLLGLKIVNERGLPINAGQSIGRLLSMIFLSSIFFGMGYFMGLFTEKRQALHDLVAGTIVIKG